MTTGTAAPAPPSRQDPRQVLNTLKRTVNWNDADVADMTFANSLPQNAFITGVFVEVVTAIDGTPSLVVGTVSTAYNNIVAAGDVDEATTGVYVVNRALGRSLASAAPVAVHAKLTFGGTPTAGRAVIVIQYEGGWVT